MKRSPFALCAALLLLLLSARVATTASAAESAEGVTTKPSQRSVAETVERLESLVKAKNLTLFARIDHSAEATKAGLTMRPTVLLIFGSPKAGTPAMVAAPSLALDLPLKALVWQDAEGKTQVSYNSAAYLQARHHVPADVAKPLGAIDGLIDEALKP